MSTPRSTASSVREQKLARVIDREVAPIWHDRFARLLLRELPSTPETFALDIHSGPGHTTAELLQRLDESSRIVALGRDPWLMQVSKTRVRPEWKRRVYFKSGDIDDVTDMNDDTYDLSVANLVLGEQVVEWQPALAELVRVTKPGGQVLTTLPMSGTWREVEDMFEEVLRDEGMRREVATLQKLRRRRPKPSQLVAGLHEIGLSDQDFVVEHERFELLFRSGREFLFAPVIEHGPLRLWKAIIGRAEKPQALFWRFKEAIDTYYAGHVLAVTVVAGLVRLRVPGGEPDNFVANYWSRYPTLSRLWSGAGAEILDASEDDFEFDLDIDLDETDAASEALTPGDAGAGAESGEPETELAETLDETAFGFADAGAGFSDMEVSGANELPAIEDVPLSDDGDDPFAGLLEELDAEAAAAAAVAAEDAEVEATATPRPQVGRAATLGAVEHSPLPGKLPRKPGDSGLSPLPTGSGSSGSGLGRFPRKPGDSGVTPLPEKLADRLANRRSESGISPLPAKPPTAAKAPLASRLPPRTPGESGTAPIPDKLPTIPKSGPMPSASKLSDRLPGRASGLASKLPRRTGSGVTPIPPGAITPPASSTSDGVSAPGEMRRKPGDTKSLLARLPKRASPRVAPPPAGPPTPAAPKPPVIQPTGPQPRVTKPGEDDPFASMLDDQEDDDFEELDSLEDSLFTGEVVEDDDDFADSFGSVSPDPAAGRSGSRPVPPPPPTRKKK